MNKVLALLAMILLLTGTVFAEWPEGYHNPEEIEDFLFDLQQRAEDADKGHRMHIDTLGYSQQNQWPMYVVRVSDNAATARDCTAVVFFGPLHAEEVSGVELVLEMLEEVVLDTMNHNRYRREYLDLYFIPTMNPEGMGIVYGTHPYCSDGYSGEGMDPSFRKNCRIIPEGDSIFYYNNEVYWGGDLGGVDLNRNWDINFYHGDTLGYPERDELHDYYRGFYALSEAEMQAVRDFIYEVKPYLSATFHNSRTGNFSEKVMYPWDWGLTEHDKQPPDSALIKDIALNFAEIISGNSIPPFSPAPSGGRNGKMHDWMYAEGGWINMQTELRGIQPDREQLDNPWLEEYKAGLRYLMDRAYGNVGNSSCNVVFRVTDESGAPLHAEVRVPSRHNGYFKPRMTNPETGVYRRPFNQGSFEIVTRAYGFYNDTTTIVTAFSGIIGYDISLTEMPHHQLRMGLYDGNADSLSPNHGKFVVHHDWGIDTLVTNDGIVVRNWPEGDYVIEAWADGYIPFRDSITLDQETVFQANLVYQNEVWRDGFEEQTIPNRWVSDGDFSFVHSGHDQKEGEASLQSGGGPSIFLPNNSSGSVTLTIDMPEDMESVALMGWRAFELEPDYDFCEVELRADGGDWIALETLNSFSRWQQFFYDLREYNDAGAVEIRWTITMDHSNNDRGLFLDEVALVSNALFEAPEQELTLPHKYALDNAYPNPFNPTTTISYSVAANAPVKMTVFDVLGREVMTVVDGIKDAGDYRVAVDLSGFSGGVYFVRMDAPDFTATRKLVLVK